MVLDPRRIRVAPFRTPVELVRVIEYFHGAEDPLLARMGVHRALLPDRDTWLERLSVDLDREPPAKETFYLSWLSDGHPLGAPTSTESSTVKGLRAPTPVERC
jgi:hypothetical protein